MCAAAFQEARVAVGTAQARLHVAARVGVVPKAGKPELFAVHVLRRDARGDALLPATLVVRDERDQWTDEFRALRHAMGMPARVD